MVIAPAIIPENETDIKEHLLRVRGCVRDVQIDIVDGVYASPPSWPYKDKNTESLSRIAHHEGSFPMVGEFSYEVDLMVNEPESIAGTCIDLGATRIVLHFGSAKDLGGVIKNLSKKFGYARDFAPNLLSIGIALSIDTPLTALKSFTDDIDFIQLMGIDHEGLQGQHFDEKVIPRIRECRKLYPTIPVQIDGGVSLQNAPKLFEAGASRLIVGSKFWASANYEGTVEAFTALAEQYGIYE